MDKTLSSRKPIVSHSGYFFDNWRKNTVCLINEKKMKENEDILLVI